MQDRYVGDVGDFVTYGLLRVLCAAGTGRLGVVWYLVADETHNADGRHVTYLQEGNRIGKQLRVCDPSLFDALVGIVESEQRRVYSVERSDILPVGTRFFSTPIERAHRQTWLGQALRATRDCDTVFVDPDNGIAFGSPAVPEKYAHVDELTPLLERGQSLVVYQHANRTTGVEQQATRLLHRLSESLPIEPFAAVIARRGTVRMFVLLPQPRHRDLFAAAIRCIETSPWATHLRPIHHRQHAAGRIQRTSASRRRR